MFSLCIPTMDRYDQFLSKTLPRYLKNEYVSEVVVRDENGRDADRIEKEFSKEIGSGKLKVLRNGNVLGPMMNKLAVCRDASSTWIALIDSDNFADKTYFKTASDYISLLRSERGSDEALRHVVLAPSFAKPALDFRFWTERG